MLLCVIFIFQFFFFLGCWCVQAARLRCHTKQRVNLNNPISGFVFYGTLEVDQMIKKLAIVLFFG